MKRVLPLLLLFTSNTAIAGEWSGYVSAEYLWFTQDAALPQQEDSYFSGAFEPEYFHEWNNGYDIFTFKPFYREDQHDDERSHGDLRELSWLHAGEDWEIIAGVSKVFWGVTESIHLVDIINQTDLVENIDGEDKLGQPMINLTFIRDWGIVSAFVLPGFRERTFPGVEGRPRFAVPVDVDNPIYEDDDKDRHIDLAIRYSHSVGDWDIGLAHFTGTAREPRLAVNGPPVFPGGPPSSVAPLYEQINQTSIDLQANIGDWLWKLEAFRRSGQADTFNAAAGGFEYTFVGVFDTSMDIGMISEYLYDGRGTEVTSSPFFLSPFQNDIVIGMRLTLNDAQSTEVLASIITDLDDDGETYNIEASRRLGDSWKLSIEARGVSGAARTSPLFSFDKDNRIRTELAFYF